MNRLDIVDIEPSKAEDTYLTEKELGTFSPGKTLQITSERRIQYLERQLDQTAQFCSSLIKSNEGLTNKIGKNDAELSACRDTIEKRGVQIESLRRGKVELSISSVISGTTMTIGSLIISANPIKDGHMPPWQLAGWLVIGFSFFSVSIRRILGELGSKYLFKSYNLQNNSKVDSSES